ncbi:MAG TPA: hypothetical protein VN820_00785 [Acidimicrobiales bacterium]|nr:hypothetical protein [Acidimicrobiales bacterium]
MSSIPTIESGPKDIAKATRGVPPGAPAWLPVGGGKLAAVVTDADGNPIGLTQAP